MSELTGITEDTLLDGAVTIFQPERGFRAGTDSVLLGASLANLKLKGQKIAEFGCGAGGALFPAMRHLKDGQFTAIEQDTAMADLAGRGARANKVSDRLNIITSCVRAFSLERENAYDLVFSNPPYFEPGKTVAPEEGKKAAYIESLSLDDWLKAMLFVTRPQGFIVMIHRAGEIARILTRLDRQAGEISIMPIRPYPGAEANRVLVRARKGLRSGRVQLLDGIDIFTKKGGIYTPRIDAVMRGESLDWI